MWSVEGWDETRSDTSWSGSGEVSFEIKPLPAVTVEAGPEFTRERDETQDVRTVADAAASETSARVTCSARSTRPSCRSTRA